MHTCALAAGIHEGRDTGHDGGHAAGARLGVAFGDWVGPHLLQQGSLIAVVGDVGQHAGSYGVHLLEAHAVCHLKQLHMRLRQAQTHITLMAPCESDDSLTVQLTGGPTGTDSGHDTTALKQVCDNLGTLMRVLSLINAHRPV